MIKLHFSQENPYSNEWTCIDESYDCDWDSERGFYSTSPYGRGDTKQEALLDYLDQRNDLTDLDVQNLIDKYEA